MPATPSRRIPSYRLHKPTGQAVVTLDGKDHYVGRHDSPESRVEYHRLVGEWEANGRRRSGPSASGSDRTVNEVLVAYLEFAASYYLKNGVPTTMMAGGKT